jgi:amino acid transporter
MEAVGHGFGHPAPSRTMMLYSRGGFPSSSPGGSPDPTHARMSTDAVPEVESKSGQKAPPRPNVGSQVWRTLIGRPLKWTEAAHGEITPLEGLPALSLDALTSVAYGPEAIVLVLGTAGVAALHLVLPITIGIVALLAILVISYRQVIDGYPHGGGAYAVSRANLGSGVSQLAAASLIVDYTLTVAVSIAAGIAALTSAFPSVAHLTVPLCLVELAVLTVLNLRGLGETARAFLLPTFLFIVGLLVVIAIGIVHPLDPNLALTGTSQTAKVNLAPVGLLLILKAFSAGCSALTGVEAIANGVPLFKEPRAVRAKRTELLLGVIPGSMLLGLAILADRWHIGPRSGQTVLSQIMAEAVGRNWAYYTVSLTITVVLALAANTSFGGLPVLASLLARDNYLPHLFAQRGDRQVFANGIVVLAVMSGALLVAVRGNTNTLIPLFAIGVFIGFTLAQTGMVVHWRRTRPPGWQRKATVNGIGAFVTAVSTVVFLYSKFTEGAWVVVIAVPTFIYLFTRIHRYYQRVAVELAIGQIPGQPVAKRTTVVVPVTHLSRLCQYAVSEALSLGQEVIAVTVILEQGEESDRREEEIQSEWDQWDPGAPLHVLHTDYSSIVDPILEFIDELRARTDDQIVVLIPVILPTKIRYRILHNQIDLVLSTALRSRSDIVVARTSLPVSELEEAAAARTSHRGREDTTGPRPDPDRSRRPTEPPTD